jgi:NADH dehydrogenase
MRPRVLVVGAGHAGLAVTHGVLSRIKDASVVLFEPRDQHVLKPRLVETLSDAGFPIELPIAPLVDSKRITWVHDAADEVTERAVEAGGRRWEGDWLVIACGARTRRPKGARGGKARKLFSIDGPEDVEALRVQLLGCVDEAAGKVSAARRRALLSVLVVGGGYTGVESAAEIALLLRRRALDAGLSAAQVHVTLCEQRERLFAGGVPDEETGRRVDEALAARAVDVRLGTEVRFDGGVPMIGRRESPAATIVLATGIDSRLGRRLPVDATLRAGETTFALGDAAVVVGAAASAQHAVQEGRHAAEVIAALEKGKRPPDFHPATAGEFVTLGDGDVVGWVQIAGRRVHLTGFPAAAARAAAFARYLAGLRLGAARI